MAKQRGRKRKNDLYFGPEQEEAVVAFLTSDDIIERNRIYNKHLRSAFDKMAESIIRKYKLYRKGWSFEDLHADTLSFLIMKSDKFQPSKGKKAYSYYGTIIKNYILGLLIKDDKVLKQVASFEDTYDSIKERDDLTYNLEDNDYTMDDFIKKIADEIKDELYDEEREHKKKLSENERKVGEALVAILEDWETTLNTMEGGAKYNKNSVLETMRNYTRLSTKDIRVSMKRFKSMYGLLKQDIIDNGML